MPSSTSPRPSRALRPRRDLPAQAGGQLGSQTTEYALIMVVAATIAALALAWARGGAVAGLLDGVLEQVRSLFGIG